MAGTITHLVIADKLLKVMPKEIMAHIKNVPFFFCGNLAPDAIMARKNYVREMKKFTHFKDGIGEDELSVPENYALYKKRFNEFIENYVNTENPYFELYLGYMTHMIADEVFILKVRDRHVDELRKVSVLPGYEDYFTQFGRDVDLNDWRLLREYTFSRDVLKDIQSENAYEIEGMITNEELIASKKFIINKNFLTRHPLDEKPRFLSYEENSNYIELAVDEIRKVLVEMASSNAT